MAKGFGRLNANDVRYTKLGKTVYVIQLGWDPNLKQKTLSTFAKKAKDLDIKSIRVLGTKEKIKWSKTEEGLIINTPVKKPINADIAFVYKIEIK